MKYLYDYDSLNESVDADTIKKMVLDFAEKKGKSKWKELQGVILQHKGLDPKDRSNRGQFSSYFSGGSSWYPGETKSKHGRTDRSHGLLMRPTKKDPRYLDKEGNMYVVKTWDGKSKLS
tara:strand:+ start:203 stop:559 length:357 start_codon:yes stop_codon:yes gene_type:complete